jgi:hypothetical protein
MTLRFLAALVFTVLIGGCGQTGFSSPEIIAGGETTVSIASGKFIDPTETAETFCSGQGRKAVFQSRGVLSRSGMTDLYIYDCVEPEMVVEEEVLEEIPE